MTGRETTPAAVRRKLSESQEDYVKQIHILSGGQGTVSTQMMAGRVGVRPASVTGMVRRLAQLGMVLHRPYRGVRLTDMGAKAALEIVRHHRLIETCLNRTLGYGLEEVHDEAERMEHAISEGLAARIDEVDE